MKPVTLIATFSFIFLPQTHADQPAPPNLPPQDQQALDLGRKVIKARAALKIPAKKASIDAIRELGLDSRYYVMTRGWITQHISMAESYRGTSKYKQDEKYRKQTDDRITALRNMLRSIDLE